MTTKVSRRHRFVDQDGTLTQYGWSLLNAIQDATGGADPVGSETLSLVAVEPSGGPGRADLPGEDGDDPAPLPQPYLNGLRLHQVFGDLESVLTETATLDFGSISSQSSAELTVSVTKAAVGDAVFIAAPASPAADLVFYGYVSAADTVTIRAVNGTAGPVDPDSADYRVVVFHFLG